MRRKFHSTKVLVFCCILAIIVSFSLTFSVQAAPKRKKLEIQAGMFGGAVYQVSYSLSVSVNKYSKRLWINITETAGTPAGIIKCSEKPPDRLLGGAVVTVMEALRGVPPFDKPYMDMRIVGNWLRNANTIITTDPTIKTVHDLVGKRLGLGPKPTVLGKNWGGIILYGNDIPEDKVKTFYMKWPRLKDALLDGSIDAMIMGTTVRPKGKWVPVPVYQEIINARKKIYFIPQSAESVKKASARDKITYPTMVIPKDIYGPGQPAQDTPAWYDSISLFAHKDLDPDIVYELTKILYEHCEEMGETTAIAKGISKELVADIIFSDDMIHPGALKYYKEKGLR